MWNENVQIHYWIFELDIILYSSYLQNKNVRKSVDKALQPFKKKNNLEIFF